jgi:hypothetical protein
MDASDQAVLEAIERDVLRPEVVSAAIRKAVERLTPATDVSDGQRNTSRNASPPRRAISSASPRRFADLPNRRA